MKLRLLIHTPAGMAKKTSQDLRPFLLGLKRPTATGYNENSFYWEIECNYKSYINLTKKIYLFQQMAAGVMDAKTLQKAAKSLGTSAHDYNTARELLVNGTSIEIIKNAQADEIIEANTTYWEKLKARFSRQE